MGWIEKKSITRIFNTFKRLKTGIYTEDIEALKQLNESNENASKSFVHGNLVFAKLYALALRQNLNYYGSVKMAIKGINEELSKDINFQLGMLTKEINQKEINEYFKSLGFDMDKVFISDSVNGILENNILKENEKEIVAKLKNNWSLENVSQSFYKSANDVLKDVNNYS